MKKSKANLKTNKEMSKENQNMKKKSRDSKRGLQAENHKLPFLTIFNDF